MSRRTAWVVLALLLSLPARTASAVVVTEIHYNPAGGADALEFLELAGETTTPEDLSGYRFTEGIRFEFPPGTILGKGDRIVVCRDAAALTDHYGAASLRGPVLGDFVGRLDGSGERITLVDSVGTVVLTLRYNDRGKWPAAADGTGHSLVLLDVHLDPGEPESWTWSPEPGGSPGRPNFPASEESVVDLSLVDLGDVWRYRRGLEAFSSPPAAWVEAAYDDGEWASGPAGFGYGDGDDATELDDMRDGYTSVACRIRFTRDADALVEGAETWLAIDYDDGFCAWVNGVEVARSNSGDEGEAPAWDDTASGAREAGSEEWYRIPDDRLVDGENTVAILGLNFSLTSSDFSLAPRVVSRSRLDGQEATRSVLFSELVRDGPGGAGWCELHGAGRQPVDLSGSTLSTDPDAPSPWAFPDGSLLPPGGFLVVSGDEASLDLATDSVLLVLRDPGGLVVAASQFDRPAPPGLAAGEWSEARFPDDGLLDWVSDTPTPGEPNVVPAERDIVIHEIFYHPPEDRPGEYIELHNRGTIDVDLSGFRFTKGIDYIFEEGTHLAAGACLVVAEDPELTEEVYEITGVHGPWTGRLSDDGENIRLVDGWGNPVDRVRYHEGGEWSRWADGGGASLELIDPLQDNSVAAAWAASDESASAPWERLSYTVSDYVPSGESELHLFLVERGICRIDDVSVRRDDGPDLVPNGGFESSTTPWRIQGTHVRTRRVTGDAAEGSACLEIVASGKGDTTVNRIETDTSPRLERGPYEVSLQARWLRGASVLVAHGEFAAGPHGGRPGPAVNLSANSLGGRFRLTVPWRLGTPGAENSATRILREETGAANLGPVLSEVRNEPPSPAPGELARVTARVSDADGVDDVRVLYRTGHGEGAFETVALLDDGGHGDGRADDGVWGGDLPDFPAGTKVVFYVEATDADGRVGRFPREAPEATSLFRVRGAVNQPIDSYRVLLDDRRTAELQSRPLHSNDLLYGSFVFDNERIYYNVGVRYRGSPWGRPGRNSYRVRFPDDDRLHQERDAVNLSSRGSSATEGVAYYLAGRQGTEASPCGTAELFWVRTYFNGASLGTQAAIQPVGMSYIERWYGEDPQGPVLKAVGRLAFNDAGSRTAWDGASFVHMGTDPEAYRGYYFHSIRRSRDDWGRLIELTRTMDRRVTGNSEFDRTIDDILDTENFLRHVGFRALLSDWDAFTVGNGHNGYLVFDARDGRWDMLPFDMDNSMGDANSTIFPSADGDVARLLSRPAMRRLYARVIHELLDGAWAPDRSGPMLDAIQRDVGLSTGSQRSFLASRATSVRRQIDSYLGVDFRVLAGAGGEITTDGTTVTIEGEAPATIALITSEIDRGGLEPLAVTWTTPTRWRADIDLTAELTEIRFSGFDGRGDLVAFADVTVRTTAFSDEPRIAAWFPSAGPAAGGFEVVFVGSRLEDGAEVLFGGVPSPEVTTRSSLELVAIAPPAPRPFPPGGRVDVEVVFPGGGRITLADGIVYDPPDGFLRGDANGDLSLDLSDAVKTLLHLFAGGDLSCPDAADVDDDGALRISDPIALLDFLFRGGGPPPPPFPSPGEDPTADALGCP